MTTLEEALLERFEQFTGVLCLTAQYGQNAGREQTYAEIRDWMRANHDQLTVLLAPATIDLFDASTLQELLESDDGELIGSVGQISETLYHVSD